MNGMKIIANKEAKGGCKMPEIKENEIFSSGDFFYNGMFCIGKLIDGSYGAFDNAEDYESYKRKVGKAK